MQMWSLRLALFLLLAFLLLYAVNSEVEHWCDDEFSRCKSRWGKFMHNLTEQQFLIPEAHRQPLVSMKEFYAVPDRGLTDLMLRTRLTYRAQNHLGTVMRDGFHIDLPEDTMWRGGVLVSGPDVRQQMTEAKHVPGSVASSPSPSVR